MRERKIPPRGAALAVGTIVLFLIGIVYAWSIYSSPFSERFGWSSASLGVCFTLIISTFCLGGVLGGISSARLGSGRTIILGGAMAGLGYLLSTQLTAERMWLLYLGFSVSGLGSGVVYNAVLSNVNGRFADKRGTASGIMLMGFGTSTLVIGSLAARLIASPLDWKGTYVITGLALILVSAAGGLILKAEPDAASASATDSSEGMTSRQMLGTASFWLVFAAATINCFFGFGVLGHARYMALEGGLSAAAATTAVGLVSVVNGAGRLFFGVLHDKKGYSVSFPVSSCIFMLGAVLAIVGLRAHSGALVTAGLMCGGLGNSAAPTILSSLSAELYGRANYGKNLSIFNMNMLPGSLGATVAGLFQTRTGSYTMAFALFFVLELPALIMIRILAKRESRPADSSLSEAV